ncbi:hypothetical protein ACFQPG_07975 [Sphingomonas sp. GCM10030256]|uniref:hypothetical protein n=1 Tax=Sphingomonas sp. GCM10030256 TaxID=3273427 RepID=UPI00360F63F5
MIARLLLPLLVLTAVGPTAAAASVTVKQGETWIFAVERGQPVRARRVQPNAAAKAGEIKASLRTMLGTNLTISSQGKVAYTYRAELLDRSGRATATRASTLPAGGKPTFEYWREAAVAVRLSDFKAATTDGSCP